MAEVPVSRRNAGLTSVDPGDGARQPRISIRFACPDPPTSAGPPEIPPPHVGTVIAASRGILAGRCHRRAGEWYRWARACLPRRSASRLGTAQDADGPAARVPRAGRPVVCILGAADACTILPLYRRTGVSRRIVSDSDLSLHQASKLGKSTLQPSPRRPAPTAGAAHPRRGTAGVPSERFSIFFLSDEEQRVRKTGAPDSAFRRSLRFGRANSAASPAHAIDRLTLAAKRMMAPTRPRTHREVTVASGSEVEGLRDKCDADQDRTRAPDLVVGAVDK